jgi:hypothetical protein
MHGLATMANLDPKISYIKLCIDSTGSLINYAIYGIIFRLFVVRGKVFFFISKIWIIKSIILNRYNSKVIIRYDEYTLKDCYTDQGKKY